MWKCGIDVWMMSLWRSLLSELVLDCSILIQYCQYTENTAVLYKAIDILELFFVCAISKGIWENQTSIDLDRDFVMLCLSVFLVLLICRRMYMVELYEMLLDVYNT